MSAALSYQEGGSTPGLYPTLQAQVLAATAAASGVPTPPFANLANYVVTMQGDATVPLVPANPNRTFLLIYNPTQMPAQFSKGNATQGAINNLSIGPGQAYFTATAQGLGAAYPGALTAIGLYAGLPLWAWEDGTQLIGNLANDTGVLQLTSNIPNWPTSPVGLAPGALWNNGLTVSVMPPTTPNPSVAPVMFGSITAANLLALGGANLPVLDPGNTFQLWNNGGLVCISIGAVSPGKLDFSQASNSMYVPVVL